MILASVSLVQAITVLGIVGTVGSLLVSLWSVLRLASIRIEIASGFARGPATLENPAVAASYLKARREERIAHAAVRAIARDEKWRILAEEVRLHEQLRASDEVLRASDELRRRFEDAARRIEDEYQAGLVQHLHAVMANEAASVDVDASAEVVEAVENLRSVVRANLSLEASEQGTSGVVESDEA